MNVFANVIARLEAAYAVRGLLFMLCPYGCDLPYES